MCTHIGGVPPDDLSLLRGCVSRNRVLFSPTLSENTASIQLGGMKSTGTWPDLIPSQDTSNSQQTTARLHSPDEPCTFQESPLSLQYSVSIQFGKNKLDDGKSLQESPVHASSVYYHPMEDSNSMGHKLCPVSWSIPGRLNSPVLKPFRKVDHMTHSRSSCSCASYTLERTPPEQRHILNIPVMRTNSLDGQSSSALHSHKCHAKGQYAIHVHIHLVCTCMCLHYAKQVHA